LDEYDRKPCFEIDLSNGFTIYSDDDRPGLEESSTWLRLAKYIQESKVDIVGYRVRFRSNVQHIAYNADGYYFAHAVLGSFGSPDTVEYYTAGYLKDGVLKVKRFQKPALNIHVEEFRNWKDAKQCLIINPSIMEAYQQDRPNI
jgi:hypothetical protein